jgi:2-methylcitrate synthase
MHTSLILYAEHEFNASTFTARVIAGTGSDMYSCITGAIGALAAPSTAAPTRSPRDPAALRLPDEAEADIRAASPQGSHHRLRPPGLHHQRPAQRGHQKVALQPLSQRRRLEAPVTTSPSASSRHVDDAKRMFPNLDWFSPSPIT